MHGVCSHRLSSPSSAKIAMLCSIHDSHMSLLYLCTCIADSHGALVFGGDWQLVFCDAYIHVVVQGCMFAWHAHLQWKCTNNTCTKPMAECIINPANTTLWCDCVILPCISSSITILQPVHQLVHCAVTITWCTCTHTHTYTPYMVYFLLHTHTI